MAQDGYLWSLVKCYEGRRVLLNLRHLAASEPQTQLGPGVSVAQLLRKRGKSSEPEVRGPLVDDTESKPLAALCDGDKLNILASCDRTTVAVFSPQELVLRLGELGLRAHVRLKQIHLLVDHTGSGGRQSYAEGFAKALAVAGFEVQEIKAPQGQIRCDDSGNVLIKPSESNGGFLPSDKNLNYYTGPGVQEKHRI